MFALVAQFFLSYGTYSYVGHSTNIMDLQAKLGVCLVYDRRLLRISIQI